MKKKSSLVRRARAVCADLAEIRSLAVAPDARGHGYQVGDRL